VSVPEENVSVIHTAYETLAHSGIDAFSEYWAEDIEWQAIGGSWNGRADGRAYMEAWSDLFEDFTTEPIELTDAGSGQVVMYVRYRGRLRRTGMEVPPEYFAILFEVRDGRIVRAREYATSEEAIEAAHAGGEERAWDSR
jgi:ketosteroid isomerase-like protein